MSAIITIVQQTGSQFAPHPLLPHAKACYYSRIILNSLPLLLFSKLFWHNYLRPSAQPPRHLMRFIDPTKKTCRLMVYNVPPFRSGPSLGRSWVPNCWACGGHEYHQRYCQRGLSMCAGPTKFGRRGANAVGEEHLRRWCALNA